MSNEKNFTLVYNDYKISLKIKKDYKDTIKRIKERVFLQDKDFKKMNLNYFDQYGGEDPVDEEIFPFVFDSSSKLILKPKEIFDDDEENKKDKKSSEIDSQLKSIFSNDQKEVNRKILQTKNILFSEMYKLINEKIVENNKIYDQKITNIKKKYEEKTKKLEDEIKSLKEKNEILERNQSNDKEELNKEIKNIKNELNQMANSLANMKNEVKGSKDNFKKLQSFISSID